MQDEQDNKANGGAGSGFGGAWPRIERIRTDTSAIRHFPAQRLSDTGHGDIPDESYEQDGDAFEDGEDHDTHSSSKNQNVAVAESSMHIEPPKLKPGLIGDILRTRQCAPGSVFLVERIDDLPIYLADQDLSSGSASEPETESDCEWEEDLRPNKRTVNNLAAIIRQEQRELRQRKRLQRRRDKAKEKTRHRIVRLMLGDGELCIHSLLRPGTFGLLDGGLVYEGCYVRLGSFEIVETEVDDFGQVLLEQERKGKTRVDREDDLFGDPALVEASRGSGRKVEKQERGHNKMLHLVVGEMTTVGWNSAYLDILRDQEVGGKVEQEVVTVRDGKVKSTGPRIVVPVGAEVEVISDEAAAVATEFDMAGAPLNRVVAEESRHQVCAEAPRQSNFAALERAAVDSQDTTTPPPETMVSPYSFAKAPTLRNTDNGRRDTSPRKFLPPQGPQHPSPGKPKPTNTATLPSAMMKYDDIEDDLDDEPFEKLDISMDRVAKRRLFDTQQAQAQTPRISNNGQGGALQELQTAVVEQNKVNANTSRTPHHNPNLALAITDPHQPLKITPLRSIPNLPYKQNWMVNVLAVVVSLSSVEPSHLPPYSQRTARLADLSTSKRVLLNVFLDPEEFAPAVGSVVLLVGVKNHRFDGGCLKKYVSDRPPGKATWWLENPGLEWCAGEVGRLRSWWREQQQLQQQEVHDGELDKMQI